MGRKVVGKVGVGKGQSCKVHTCALLQKSKKEGREGMGEGTGGRWQALTQLPAAAALPAAQHCLSHHHPPPLQTPYTHIMSSQSLSQETSTTKVLESCRPGKRTTKAKVNVSTAKSHGYVWCGPQAAQRPARCCAEGMLLLLPLMPRNEPQTCMFCFLPPELKNGERGGERGARKPPSLPGGRLIPTVAQRRPAQAYKGNAARKTTARTLVGTTPRQTPIAPPHASPRWGRHNA